MSMIVSFLCCPFSPQDVLDEILDLIESVSEGFPAYSYIQKVKHGPNFKVSAIQKPHQ